jgi:hypothetical protein
MRGVSRWASRVAPLLAVFVVFAAADAWADEPLLTNPPQARLGPPGGVAAQARVSPPVGIAPPPPPDATTQARLNPPVGGAARMSPPVGAPMTLADMILMWLQSRISVPNG